MRGSGGNLLLHTAGYARDVCVPPGPTRAPAHPAPRARLRALGPRAGRPGRTQYASGRGLAAGDHRRALRTRSAAAAQRAAGICVPRPRRAVPIRIHPISVALPAGRHRHAVRPISAAAAGRAAAPPEPAPGGPRHGGPIRHLEGSVGCHGPSIDGRPFRAVTHVHNPAAVARRAAARLGPMPGPHDGVGGHPGRRGRAADPLRRRRHAGATSSRRPGLDRHAQGRASVSGLRGTAAHARADALRAGGSVAGSRRRAPVARR